MNLQHVNQNHFNTGCGCTGYRQQSSNLRPPIQLTGGRSRVLNGAEINWRPPVAPLNAGADPAQGYHIYRDSIRIGTADLTAGRFADTNVQPGKHLYQVSTFDQAGNEQFTCPIEIITQ